MSSTDAFEFLIRISRSGESGRDVSAEPIQVALKDWSFDPNRIQITNLKNRFAWRDLLADRLVHFCDVAAQRRAYRVTRIRAADVRSELRNGT